MVSCGKIILLSSQMPLSSPRSYCRINRDLSFLLKRETGESASERRPRSPSIQWVGGDLTRDDGLSEAAVFSCGRVDRIRTERVRHRLKRRQDGREGDAAARQKGKERRRTTDREGRAEPHMRTEAWFAGKATLQLLSHAAPLSTGLLFYFHPISPHHLCPTRSGQSDRAPYIRELNRGVNDITLC